MNVASLNKVTPLLNVLSVHPVKIDFEMNLNKQPTTVSAEVEQLSFSRLQWTCSAEALARSPLEADETNLSAHIISFLVDTTVEIADQPDTGPIPESDSIPLELLISVTKITFAVDYQCSIDPTKLDAEGMSEFIHNNIPYHLWPYWRELAQNLALRAQLPLPHFPSYRVQKVVSTS